MCALKGFGSTNCDHTIFSSFDTRRKSENFLPLNVRSTPQIAMLKTFKFFLIRLMLVCARDKLPSQLRSFLMSSMGFLYELLFGECSASESSSWTLISSSDSLGWGLMGGDWLVEVDEATLLLCASDAA